MRIFSVTQWHHFAYMIISIALLGFGASGSFIAIFHHTLQRRFMSAYRLCAALFPLSIFVCYFLSQQNRFNPFEIVWNPRQYLHLLEYYLILFIPFFLAALCIGLLFTHDTNRIGLIYCANLTGSGIGAVAAILCLWYVHPVHMLYIVAGLAFVGFAVTFVQSPLTPDRSFMIMKDLSGVQNGPLHVNVTNISDFSTRRKTPPSSSLQSLLLIGSLCGMTLLTIFAVRHDHLFLRPHLNISQYKGFQQAQKFPEAEILAETVSPFGVAHAISSPVIRHAPGLSVNYAGDVPSQIGLFVDSGNAGAIVPAEPTEYLDYLSSSLVYHIRPAKRTLILGAGGGMDVRNALVHDASLVDAVELNPQTIAFVKEDFHEFSSGIYSHPKVRVFNQEARHYVETTPVMYHVIQISLLDSFAASSAGVHALHENYLYTIEAFKNYYTRLTPQGVLSITRWVKFPPRENIKLFATAVEALETSGVSDVPHHLISIRSWATSTLLVSKIPFTPDEVKHARQFCQTRAFDMNYFPGISEKDANRHNQIPSAEYYSAAQHILFGDRQTFYNTYPYFIRPARDDSPYFFHFFTWKSLPTLLKTMGKEWIPFLEWGYLVLLATLVQAGFLSILLILIPLSVLRHQASESPTNHTGKKWRFYTSGYFSCLGLGYLFLEMVFIQKFTLFLANPIYSVSVVIASFLIFSGLGSAYFHVKTFTKHLSPKFLIFAIAGIVGFSNGYIFVMPRLLTFFAGWNSLLKIVLTIAFIAPLGFCMGIPFPFGMNRLHQEASELVPWAYGINGCTSVLSSLLATSIAIPWGFKAVLFSAGLLYMLAAGINSWGICEKH